LAIKHFFNEFIVNSINLYQGRNEMKNKFYIFASVLILLLILLQTDVYCSEEYYTSELVTLDASGLQGSIFSGWSGGGCSGNGSCSISISSDTTVTASFNQLLDLPDLAGSWSDITKKKLKKSHYLVEGKLTVSNTGTANASKVHAHIYLSYDEQYDSGDTYLGSKTIKKLKSGKSKTLVVSYKISIDPSGYYLITVIDPENNIQESNKDNNLSISDAIPPPRLPSDPLDNWHLRADIPTLSFTDMVYASDTFVAVVPSDNILMGGILTSTDGYNWTMRDSGDHDNLNGIAYANGLLIAVGNNGTILTSDNNGKAWISRTSGTTVDLYQVAYGNGLFAVIGYGGTILISSDGINWTSTIVLHENLKDITFGNNIFVAVGENGVVFTSTGGNIWIQQNTGTSVELLSVVYGKGIFVAVGYNALITSSNGINWDINSQSEWGTQVAYGNGIFLIVGESLWAFNGSMSQRIFTSTDGIDWTSHDFNNMFNLSAITYGNGMFVALGSTDYIYHYGSRRSILTTTDTINWTIKHIGYEAVFGNAVNSVAYNNGMFIAVGEVILMSSDGTTWTIMSSDIYSEVHSLYKVIYGNGNFVALGGDFWGADSVFTSTDGINWTNRISVADNNLRNITYGNGLYVVVGDKGFVLVSDDGITWHLIASGTSNVLYGVTYGNNSFMAVGELGIILKSDDGFHWVKLNSNITSDLNGITFGNNMFVASGGGFVLTSIDKENWIEVFTTTINNVFLNGIFFGFGQGVYTSTDTINWLFRTSWSYTTVGVTYGNDTIIVATNNGIFQSDPF
jgi:hypothetical protein